MYRKSGFVMSLRQGRHKNKQKKYRIGHHAKPRRASATAPLLVGADRCRTGAGGGTTTGAAASGGAIKRSHDFRADQSGRHKPHRTGAGRG